MLCMWILLSWCGISQRAWMPLKRITLITQAINGVRGCWRSLWQMDLRDVTQIEEKLPRFPRLVMWSGGLFFVICNPFFLSAELSHHRLEINSSFICKPQSGWLFIIVSSYSPTHALELSWKLPQHQPLWRGKRRGWTRVWKLWLNEKKTSWIWFMMELVFLLAPFVKTIEECIWWKKQFSFINPVICHTIHYTYIIFLKF